MKKRMKLILIFLMFFYIICHAPQVSIDEYKKKIDYFFSEILREKEIKENEKIIKEYNKEFLRFADFLGYRESRNNPISINTEGCFGEHQWQQKTLFFLGYKDITLQNFKKNPNIFPKEMQLEALKALIMINAIQLKQYDEYLGKTINGIVITKSGLIAACHLGGFTSVRMYLLSNGAVNKRDVYGTSVGKYIKDFAGFNI